MWITPAFAQDGGGGLGLGGIESMLPLVLIFVVFYFLLIRPQQKRAKQHREMLAALRRGDRVVTGGGIIGKVTKVADDEVIVEIDEGVRVTVARATIASVLVRTDTGGGGSGEKAGGPTVVTGNDNTRRSGGLLGNLLGGGRK